MRKWTLSITALLFGVALGGCIAPGEDGDDDDDEVIVESESSLRGGGIGGKVAALARGEVGRPCSEFLPYCQPTAWCVVFVDDTFSRAGAASKTGWSVQSLERWSQSRGTYKAGTKGLAPGDVLIWADGSHAGVFIGSTKRGKLRVVSGGMGDVVVRHTVAPSAIRAHVRPR